MRGQRQDNERNKNAGRWEGFYTGEDESDRVGKNLPAIIQKDEQKVDKPQSKRKKHLARPSLLLKFNDRGVLR
jgi:hypothetical protein